MYLTYTMLQLCCRNAVQMHFKKTNGAFLLSMLKGEMENKEPLKNSRIIKRNGEPPQWSSISLATLWKKYMKC